ncbi:MAG TPA: hypothetical protein VL306_01260 [Methylomirabilota bacterium]|nr:hypothetical protein [Methylomirabilota bacterium]
MGQKVLPGEREAWLKKHDEVFNLPDNREEDDQALIDLHERFLRHFSDKPVSKPNNPVAK